MENKRRHSSSSSHVDEETEKDKRFEELERMVKSLERRSHSHSSCIHRGDELMIPPFDPVKDDMVVEKWIQHMDRTSYRCNMGRPSDYEANTEQIEGPCSAMV